LNASTDRNFDAVFASLAQLRAGALVIGVDAFFNSRSDQLAALAARHALPTISAYQEFTAAAAISPFADREPEARAAVFASRGCIGLGEFLEQFAHLLRRHADTSVGDRDGDRVAATFLPL
jgi:putative ABC transport system substrate-binding protein